MEKYLSDKNIKPHMVRLSKNDEKKTYQEQ